MWFGVGQERMADSCKLIAQTAAREKVIVWWDQYEGMPHCWPFIFPKMEHSKHGFARWGKACKDMAEGRVGECRGTWMEVEGLEERKVDLKSLIELSPEEAKGMIKEKAKGMPIFYGNKVATAKI